MQMMTRMNAKLDKGWKMTNLSCSICDGTTLAEPNTSIDNVYCPKCDKNVDVPVDSFEDQEENNQKKDTLDEDELNYFNKVINDTQVNSTNNQKITQDFKENIKTNKQEAPRVNKTNECSKKIGEKLLLGWTMLNETCSPCCVPLMKSKTGMKLCCNCGKDYAIIEEPQVSSKKQLPQKKQQEKKQISKDKQSEKKLVKKSQNLEKQELINEIEMKSLSFLNSKLDKAIEQNDLSQVQKILSVLKLISLK